MEKLAIVISVKDEGCFQRYTEESLKRIGCKYTLIRTDPNIPLCHSYNTVAKHSNIEKSKYLLFIHHDIVFLLSNWGKRLLELCDGLQDLGYAGTECCGKDKSCWGNGLSYGKRWGKPVDKPKPIHTCDDGVVVIPTKLFLERQFDPAFPWYPFAEDYAIWVKRKKGLTAYVLPVRIHHTGGCHSWLEKSHKRYADYVDELRQSMIRLKQKWGDRDIRSTAWGCT